MINEKKETITVAVTSTSKHKTQAVEVALTSLYPGKQFDIRGFKSHSGVNEQPVNEETELGAYNRILSILEIFSQEGLVPDVLDLIISIESGIFQVKDNWEDKAVVIVSNSNVSLKVTEVSDGVVFPTEYVQEAERKGFENYTVGSVIAEMNPGVDGTDPHAFLTKDSENPTTRKELLEGTIFRALISYFELIEDKRETN